jgi:hypothetical protein
MRNLADHVGDIAERAAVLEYEHGVPRVQAEHQAIAEFFDRQRPQDLRPNGVLGDLLEANRNIRDPEVRSMLEPLGVLNRRSPLWGAMPIVAAGEGWQPALPGEQGEWAFIAPAFDRHGLADLVAEDMQSRQLRRRLGVAAVVGAEQVDLARDSAFRLPDAGVLVAVALLRMRCRRLEAARASAGRHAIDHLRK